MSPPKRCWGLEQHDTNTECPTCPYRVDCAEAMEDRVGSVNVDQVPFHFMPPALIVKELPSEESDPDLVSFAGMYVFCYEWVFYKNLRGHRKDSMVASLLKYKAGILERVAEAQTSIKLFFLANMLGWLESHSETKFQPKYMLSDAAVTHVKVFSKTCQERYGTFDTFALDRLMTSTVAKEDFDVHLYNSEVAAGIWIVNYRQFCSRNLIETLYREKEAALNPYWLAIEPTYFDTVLRPYMRNKNKDNETSSLLVQHRFSALQVLSGLKRERGGRKAISLFSARERIMPKAVKRVLSQWGFRSEDFQIEKIPVTEPLRFWSWLGRAIQQYNLLNFVDGYPSRFDGVFQRKNQF